MFVTMKITPLVVILVQLSNQCVETADVNNAEIIPGEEDYVRGCDALHPPGYMYAELIAGSLVGAINTVGSKINFTCDSGYRLIGSPVIKCLWTGEYSPSVPRCEYANGNCLPVEYQLPDHAQIIGITYGNRVGSIVSYTCADGYGPQGTYRMVCSNTYWWQPSTEIPKCIPITCLVPNYEHGDYVLNDPIQCSQNNSQYVLYQCVIRLICNEGYKINMQTTRMCTARNTLSNEHLKCDKIHVQCSMRSEISNGYFSYPNQSVVNMPALFDYGTTLHISCKHGYSLSGPNATSCQNSGSGGYWSNAYPYCDIVHCYRPSNIDHILYYVFRNGSRFISEQTYYNSTIYAMCTKGYALEAGSYSRTCLASGKWSGGANRCTAVYCTIPNNDIYIFTINGSTTTKNSTTDIQRLPFNTHINVSCKENVVFTGKYLRCTEKRTWDNSFPQCTSESASEKATSSNSAVIGAVVGTVVVILIAGAVVVFVLLYRKRFPDKRRRHSTDHRPERPTSIPPRRITGQQPISNLIDEYVNIQESSFNDTSSAQYADYAEVPTTAETRDEDEAYYAFDLQRMPSTAIRVEDLSDYVLRDDNVKTKLVAQFAKLSTEMMFECNEARKSINRGKNRYRNIYPYDETRVVLARTDPNQPDYINASYIHGFNKVNAYIAAQAPLIATLTDFWSMICQTGTSTIVMLTNLVELGKDKCDQYWPDHESCVYGDNVVTMKKLEEFSEFVIRTFTVTNNGKDRTVTQFHFTAWPDKGVPKYASSLVQFRNKVHFGTSHDKGPILVHCSAGIGRTGTFIALDILTEQAHTVGYVDVVGIVETLRKQRVKIVQNPEQYVFLHYAMIETLMLATSSLPAAKFRQAYERLLQLDLFQQKRNLDIEFETLTMLSPVTEDHQYVTAKQVRNRRKNRYSSILPVQDLMPRIASDDDYINAVFLPSYKEKKAFIITQTPLEATIEDFWNVVINNNVHTIVMMNSAEETTVSERYWPRQGETLTFGDVQVTTRNTKDITGHRVRTVDILSHHERRIIKQVQCNGWSSERYLPDSPHVILTLIDIVQSWQQQTGNQPIVVHCMNGADRSGLFCVISAVIERMKIEQDVAITHVIEEMRNAREQIIPTVEQYQFCHEVVLAYIEQNATYSNFSMC